jgi:hypothetical protein
MTMSQSVRRQGIKICSWLSYVHHLLMYDQAGAKYVWEHCTWVAGEASYGHNSMEWHLIQSSLSSDKVISFAYFWNILKPWTFWQAHWQPQADKSPKFVFVLRDSRRKVTSSLGLQFVEFQYKDVILWRQSAVSSPPTTPSNAQGLLANCILW